MYAKLIFAFLAIGYCSAAIYQSEKYITVSDDGTYVHVVSDNGFNLEIIKNQYYGTHGLKDFQVVLTGPNFYKTFHLNNQIAGDVIFDLCVRYQGAIDDATFHKILYKIESYVQQGDLHPKVFFFFQTLFDVEAVQHLIDGEVHGDDHFYGIYGKSFRYPYGVSGKNYFQNYYGKNFYGKNFYGKNYYNNYPYSAYQGHGYENQVNYDNAFYKTQYPYGGKYNNYYQQFEKTHYPYGGKYNNYYQNEFQYKTHYPYGGKYNNYYQNQNEFSYDNAQYKTHYPYGGKYNNYYERFNTGLNKYNVEQQIEHEVEKEVENRQENTHYGYNSQRTPTMKFAKYFEKSITPTQYEHQYEGFNQYGRQGQFGDYFGRY